MKKVFVALSGGVDSAVTAHILQSEGYAVTGVFIRVWQPDFLPCSQEEEERAALRVAAHLGIPFRRLDLAKVYKKDVVDYMVTEYKLGRTPNPDVLCNSSVKFGAFLEYAHSEGADLIATGHHACIEKKESHYVLKRGVDASKDQSYFLWRLSERELSYTRMPIGNMTKEAVREYARTHNIPSAHKPDSQGLCFIGHVDMKTFLEHYITPEKGAVLSESGEVIGSHNGAVFVTIGQRGGFTITDKSHHGAIYYVVNKDISTNSITVSPTRIPESIATSKITLTQTQWNTPVDPARRYVCNTRYHGEAIPCSITVENTEQALIQTEQLTIPNPGQSVVIYDEDTCVGGGVVA